MSFYKYWCAFCGHQEVTESLIRPTHCDRTMKAHGREDKRKALKHPTQPVEYDGNDVIRFKPNAIVRHLLDNGGLDLNKLSLLSFSREDWVQFLQLIGYSVSGFGEWECVHEEDYAGPSAAAEAVVERMEHDEERLTFSQELRSSLPDDWSKGRP